MNNDLNQQKTILITGASGGIGKACVKALLEQDFYVFAGVRNLENIEKLKQINNKNFTPLILDITKIETITEAQKTISKFVGKKGLDALINNAGILKSAPVESIPITDLREQLEVNVIGQITMIQEFLPLIRLSQGKIINISSVSGFLSFPFMGAYCASKFALEAITDALRMELKPWDISVISIQPPFIKTSLWEKALELDKLTDVNQSYQLYEDNLRKQRDKALEEVAKAIAPEKVAKIVTEVILTNNPKTKYLIGKDAYLSAILNHLPIYIKDWVILNKFC